MSTKIIIRIEDSKNGKSCLFSRAFNQDLCLPIEARFKFLKASSSHPDKSDVGHFTSNVGTVSASCCSDDGSVQHEVCTRISLETFHIEEDDISSGFDFDHIKSKMIQEGWTAF